jgi:hypothetical protein
MMQPNEPRTLSIARIDANRENAKKSTGPRTPEGKAASSRNRLVHGLRANKHILIGDDNPADFLLLLQSLDETFRPVGEGEEMLITQIAHDQWRLERALPMDAAIFRQRLEAVDSVDHGRRQSLINERRNHERDPKMYAPAPDPPAEGDRLARAFMNDCSKLNSLAALTRYKAAIQLSIDRSLRQLKIYQTARLANGPVPPDQFPVTAPTPVEQPVEPPIEQPIEQPIDPPLPPAEPREPAATPPSSTDYHSNPTNAGGAAFRAAIVFLAVFALLGVLCHTHSALAIPLCCGPDHRFVWSALL